MPHHERDADLLAGGLYLRWACTTRRAGASRRLLTDDVPAGVRNRAWFYLAKVWYARGYYDRAEQALGHITGHAAPRRSRPSAQHLLVNAPDAPGSAIDDGHRAASRLARPARLDGLCALQSGRRAGRAEPAGRGRAPILTRSARCTLSSSEMLALRDKANLALGFAYLQADKPTAGTRRARARAPGGPVLEPRAARRRLGRCGARATITARSRRGWSCAAATCSMPRCRSPIWPCRTPSASSMPNAQAADYYESALQVLRRRARPASTPPSPHPRRPHAR